MKKQFLQINFIQKIIFVNKNLVKVNNKNVKKFIKNSYLFLILFILILSKNFIFSMFKPKNIKCNDTIISSYIDQIEKINNIKNNNYKTNVTYGKIISNNIYNFKNEILLACDTTMVNINDLVIDNNFLVGKVIKKNKKYVNVMLLSNANFQIIARVNNNDYLIKNYENKLSLFDSVNLNDEVYVSPLTGFNEKIIIGTIDKYYFTPDKVFNINYKKSYNNYLAILSKDNL